MLLYAVTLLLSATLLFVVQPMVGKMVLPLLGGTPAVWSTCMVFFQAALLGGYAYAHVTAASLGVRRQALLHLAVLALPLFFLPLGIDAARLSGGDTNPVVDMLGMLALSVGLPFLVVSATAPMLQMWFAHAGHRRDPYVLYAASNVGSMVALLGYPTLIEPYLRVAGGGVLSQTRLWSVGYVMLAALIALCALALWRGTRTPAAAVDGRGGTAGFLAGRDTGTWQPVADAGTARQRLRWIALAFAPSSLLLGVTTYITTDVAAVPLLWVIPLALYLLSFIVVFARWSARAQRLVAMLTVHVVLVAVFLMLGGLQRRFFFTLSWHLLVLLVVSLACHGALALDRPPPRRLTEFYLLISVGGVLGGIFNALIAPLAFNSLIEYPMVMALACMLVTPRARHRRAEPRPDPSWRFDTKARTWRPVAADVAIAVVVALLAFLLYSELVRLRVDVSALTRVAGDLFPSRAVSDLYGTQRGLNHVLQYALPLFALFLVRRRPLAFGLAFAGALIAAGVVDARTSHRLYQERGFFGVLSVSSPPDNGGYVELRHGTTYHGRQSVDTARKAEPLSYYSRESPIGRVFDALEERGQALRVAVIGLGTGTLAAYANAGDVMTFYEIDPVVRDISFAPAYFSYVADARFRGATMRLELGDARIRMDAVRRERPRERYDLIVVDAFTSDAIPVHLITREAFALYLALLEPDGLLALHITNRYLDLAPVVGNLAEEARLGGRLIRHDNFPEIEGAYASTWAVLARTAEAVAPLAADDGWTATQLAGDARQRPWSDDFHNLLSVIKR